MLSVEATQEATMKLPRPRLGMDRRFAALETLVVFAVVAIIAAVAIPVYAARARESVLQQNAHGMAQEIRGKLALDFDSTYVAESGLAEADGDDAGLSTELARALHSAEAGRYVNPLSGSAAVVCETALPASANGAPPAVWITDDQSYAYGNFNASATTTRYLRGTLVVVFITHEGRTSCLEVFYVDAAGKRSSAATVLGVGA
jgi:type II secretory pathway pseudopilin PulG